MEMQFIKLGINVKNITVLKCIPVSSCKSKTNNQWIIRRRKIFSIPLFEHYYADLSQRYASAPYILP